MKILSFFFILSYSITFSCTTMLITKGASIDNSTIVAHSDDDELGDQRIIYVPSKDFKKGEKRAIYPEKTDFPRYVGKDRAKPYDIKGFPKSKPLGYIDQVEHTYAYIDGNYGILNEHLLAFGECTNSVTYYFEGPSKDRLFGISELSRIALERCKTAKDAIKLMGSLAEKYGYYGWGETLLVGDPDEGWVFEISSSPDGKGALWVAKKVPDGEIFVAANQFRIQNISPNDKDVLHSKNLFSIAEKNKWRKPKEPFNWQKAMCPGEFDHPYYSLRRVWRMQSRLSPSSNLSAWTDGPYTTYYPFSIKPDKKVSVKDVMHLYRDHYENTEFDLTKKIAAGPYGCPNRYIGTYDRTNFPNKRKTPLKGAWERSISIYYTGYSYVTQLRKDVPKEIGGITWIGFDEPYNTCFMPIYSGVKEMPKSFQYGSVRNYKKSFAFWPFNFVSNWIANFYNLAIEDVKKRQNLLENKQFKKQIEIEKEFLSIYKKDIDKAKKLITDYCIKNSKYVLKSWDNLGKYLIEKYSDGYINKPKIGKMVGYSDEWLDIANYKDGPIDYSKKE